MVVMAFAAVGLAIGYALGMTRRGFLALGVVALVAAAIQFGQLAASSDRSAMTLLPLVLGAVVVASMMLGALAHRTRRSGTA
jgi:hypothetical protein